MQTNFTQFNADATNIKTREYNGLTLVWSPEDSRFMLPLPDMTEPKRKILFDEEANTFIQIIIDNPAFVYRDRTATAPDGTVLQERIFIGRDKDGNTVEIPDPDFQKALIFSEGQKLRLQLLNAAQLSVPVFVLGVIVCLLTFFWNLAGSLGMVAESFATGSMTAMNEVGYLLAWGAGVLVAALALWYVVPALFRMRTTSTDYGTATPTGTEQTSTTNITVNNITGSGNTGAGNTAQDYINGRRL